MSNITRRLTGRNESELFHYDSNKGVHSAKYLKLDAQDKNSAENLEYKCNIFLFPSEVEKRRTELRQSPYPKAFRNPTLDWIGFYEVKRTYVILTDKIKNYFSRQK